MRGIDPFVLDMNREVKHSLLDNPGQYTVRVASFQGESYFQGEGREESDRSPSLIPVFRRAARPNKLEVAADNAHRLTEALRKRGVEAYEFHDRFESIVTVGSFESVGTQLPDGRLDLRPEVYKIMQTYGAERSDCRSRGKPCKPRTLDGIRFDVQPMPVKVPRRSLASTYAAGNQTCVNASGPVVTRPGWPAVAAGRLCAAGNVARRGVAAACRSSPPHADCRPVAGANESHDLGQNGSHGPTAMAQQRFHVHPRVPRTCGDTRRFQTAGS